MNPQPSYVAITWEAAGVIIAGLTFITGVLTVAVRMAVKSQFSEMTKDFTPVLVCNEVRKNLDQRLNEHEGRLTAV
jgi:hypothetical protein